MATKKTDAIIEDNENPRKVIDQVKVDYLKAEKERLTQLITHKSDRYVAQRAYERDIADIDNQILYLTTGVRP